MTLRSPARRLRVAVHDACFDHLCTGPREWDLIPAALAFRRFGSEESAYRTLPHGYDIPEVEGWDMLAEG